MLAVNIARWDESDDGETLDNVRFALPPDLRVSEVEVVDEDRVIPVQDGAFRDTFRRFQVHVYRFRGKDPPEVAIDRE